MKVAKDSTRIPHTCVQISIPRPPLIQSSWRIVQETLSRWPRGRSLCIVFNVVLNAAIVPRRPSCSQIYFLASPLSIRLSLERKKARARATPVRTQRNSKVMRFLRSRTGPVIGPCSRLSYLRKGRAREGKNRTARQGLGILLFTC